MRQIISTILLVSMLAQAALAADHGVKRRDWKLFWASVAAVAASAVLDVHSSYGKAEANPLARDPTGRLGMKGVGLKIGIGASIVGAEYLLARKDTTYLRPAAITNFAIGGAWAGVAIRNYRVAKPPDEWRRFQLRP